VEKIKMVYKVKETKIMNDLNSSFVELLKRNIDNRRQSMVFLHNDNTITINSRGSTIKYYDDVLEIYYDDELKTIIDINNIIAVVTK
jgi:hypothetical protein